MNVSVYDGTCMQFAVDRGILMTFGSGTYGCLGHGNYNDVSQVACVLLLLCLLVCLSTCPSVCLSLLVAAVIITFIFYPLYI